MMWWKSWKEDRNPVVVLFDKCTEANHVLLLAKRCQMGNTLYEDCIAILSRTSYLMTWNKGWFQVLFVQGRLGPGGSAVASALVRLRRITLAP
jgi:hypothetical protein